MNIPLRTAFAASQKFWFLFSFVSRFSFYFPLFSSLTHWLFRLYHLIFTYLWNFQFSCYWCIVSCSCVQKRYFIWFQPSWIWPNIWSILENVPCTHEGATGLSNVSILTFCLYIFRCSYLYVYISIYLDALYI